MFFFFLPLFDLLKFFFLLHDFTLEFSATQHRSTTDSCGDCGYAKSPFALMGTGLSLLRNAVLIWLLSGKALIFSQRRQLTMMGYAN